MSRLRGWLALAVVASTVAFGAALFITPPPAVLRLLVSSFPGALLTGSDTHTGTTRIIRRALEIYVQSALASYAVRQIDVTGQTDTVVLTRAMEAVRERVLTPTQVPHLPRTRSTLISGFGYCDQVNAVVARVASHYFDTVQLYALYDAEHLTSPHTIGRVWSAASQRWLYFDAFYDTPIVFERSDAGTVTFHPTNAAVKPSRGPAPALLYRLGGWVMSEPKATPGGEIGSRLMALLRGGPVEARPPLSDTAPATASGLPFALPLDRHDPPVFDRIARAYAAARLDHLLAAAPDRDAYRAIARDATAMRDLGASELATAARIFATYQ